MRVANMVLAAVLIFFAALQYNDPDPVFWGAVYLLGAAFPLLAARRGHPLARSPALRWAAWLSLGMFLIGFALLAGTINANWIHVEEAREALGYLICAGATGFALFSARRRAAAPIRS